MERGDDVGRGWARGERRLCKWDGKSAGFAAVELLPLVLPWSLPLFLLSSPSLSPCAAWVILFQQHPCLPGRGMKPSDTNKTQTKTLDVPCAGPWAGTGQTLSFSLHSPCLFLSLSFTHTHKLRVQTKSQQSAGHNRHSSSCRYYHSCLITWVQRTELWKNLEVLLRQEPSVLHYFTCVSTTPSTHTV